MRASGRRTRIPKIPPAHVCVFFLAVLMASSASAVWSRSADSSDSAFARSESLQESSQAQQQATVSVSTLSAKPGDRTKKAGAHELPVGTTICAMLAKTVDAKKAKPGDAILARTTMAVLSEGKVLIAEGAKIAGHITSVRASSRGQQGSELGIAFDRVQAKDGSQIPLALTVQAIGSANFLELPQLDPDSFPQNAAPVPGAPDLSSSTSRRSLPPRIPPAQEPRGPISTRGERGATPAVLDAGSKGISDLPGLTLTEGTAANSESMVRSPDKNVKLEGGSQLVLRVIAEKTEVKEAEAKRQD